MDRFNAAGKMFKGDGYRFQSQAVYWFLKKYIGTQELWTVRYSPNYIFPYEEFKNDNITLGDQVELIVSETKEQETQSLKIQVTKLETWKQKHFHDIRRKNVQIADLEEQKTQILQKKPLGIPDSSKN